VSTIAELTADRTVEGVYAVARKQRRTTRKGAPYLVLELVDPTGRIEGRIWNDVELLDGRFAEGDAVRVLGRVESFDNRLQLEIRSVEATDADPAGLAPRMRRDADELDGFFEFLAGEVSYPGLSALVARILGDAEIRKAMRELPAAESHHSYAGGLLEHTVGVATLGVAPPAAEPRPTS
jgi:3'-5' exoribonuclease